MKKKTGLPSFVAYHIFGTNSVCLVKNIAFRQTFQLKIPVIIDMNSNT